MLRARGEYFWWGKSILIEVPTDDLVLPHVFSQRRFGQQVFDEHSNSITTSKFIKNSILAQFLFKKII